MKTAPVSLGFLCPDPGRITTTEPYVTHGLNDTATIDGRAHEWDYNAPVRVEWVLDADLTGVLDDCGLSDDARIDAALSWHSTWTNLRGSGEVTTVVDGENTLGLRIPGHLLGGTLNLTVAVTLGDPGTHPHRLAARRPGSPLWTARRPVALEGGAARMPVMAVDFGATGRGRDRGLWLVDCDDADLTASVTGALLIYLNTSHPDIRELLERPGQPAATALERFIAYDVTRQLILRALQHDQLDESHHYDPGTVGELLTSLLRTHLPGRTPGQLRHEFRDDPGEVEAEILARAWGADS